MQYLVWPCDFTRPLSPWGKAAPVSWLSHLLRRSPLPSQQGKLYVKIFRTHVYLTSPTLPSYPYLGLVTKGACQPMSRSAQGLLQNVQREDEEVNVRRENTGHQANHRGLWGNPWTWFQNLTLSEHSSSEAPTGKQKVQGEWPFFRQAASSLPQWCSWVPGSSLSALPGQPPAHRPPETMKQSEI